VLSKKKKKKKKKKKRITGIASMPQDMAFVYGSACDHSHDFSGGPST